MADVLHAERVHVVKEVLYPVAGLIEVACVPMVMSVVPLEIAEEITSGSMLYRMFSENNILESLIESVF